MEGPALELVAHIGRLAAWRTQVSADISECVMRGRGTEVRSCQTAWGLPVSWAPGKKTGGFQRSTGIRNTGGDSVSKDQSAAGKPARTQFWGLGAQKRTGRGPVPASGFLNHLERDLWNFLYLYLFL